MLGFQTCVVHQFGCILKACLQQLHAEVKIPQDINNDISSNERSPMTLVCHHEAKPKRKQACDDETTVVTPLLPLQQGAASCKTSGYDKSAVMSGDCHDAPEA